MKYGKHAVFPKFWGPRLTRRIKTIFTMGAAARLEHPPRKAPFDREALRAFARLLAICKP